MKIGLLTLKNYISFFTKLLSSIWNFAIENINQARGSGHSIRTYLAELRDKSEHLYDTNLGLGLYHYHHGNYSDAKLRFLLMRLFCRNDCYVQLGLARAYYMLGKKNKAKDLFNKVLELDSDDVLALYYKSKIDGLDSIRYIPDVLVEEHFKYVSEDLALASLSEGSEFNLPSVVVDSIRDLFGKDSSHIKILEVCCRSGAIGFNLRDNDIAHRVDGIEVSVDLIESLELLKFEGTSVYDSLFQGNVRAYSEGCKVGYRYDVVILSNILSYDTRRIEDLLNGYKKHYLSEGGYILFVESVSDDVRENYKLIDKEDIFVYSKNYLELCIKRSDLNIHGTSSCVSYNGHDCKLFILN